ncbi:PKD domain-containing protein [Hirschia baltica]|uniref:PKD domain containing protein n=1 Tax=Hirschia baltica (strain ATCC 49814 / DSM 5838 / IFAM 1418) TaxID=582402 RepID=C6XMH7_HIRBI|nr:PKD domain-containing protein [Hirschia baltica]ACT58120.1 PKD domain containing protein [Hirschia baltica ATCC 49814]
MKLKSCVALGAFALATTLSACGGGGGSSSPTPPSPSAPAVNTPPNADISTTNVVTDERQEISLSAAGSSDADGDSLTYSWSQIAGPDLGAGTQTGDTFTAQVPELTADETYTIELTASDGQASTTQTIEIIGRKIVLTPLATEWGNQFGGYQTDGQIVPPFWSNNGSYFLTNVYTPATDTQEGKYSEYYYEPRGAGNYDYSLSYNHPANFSEPFTPPVNYRLDTSVWNDFYQYVSSNNTIEIRDNADLENPQILQLPSAACAVFNSEFIEGFDSVANSNSPKVFPNLLVALDTGGIIEYENLGNRVLTATGFPDTANSMNWGKYAETSSVFKEGGNYCSGLLGKQVVKTPTSDGHALEVTGHNFILFDEDSQNLQLFAASGVEPFVNAAPIAQMSTASITSETLSGIPQVQASIYEDHGTANHFWAIGLTTKTHDGEHYVIVINENFNEMKYMRLPNGVPTDIYAIPHQSDGIPYNEQTSDLFIISPDSPYVVYFENNAAQGTGYADATNFEDAQYIDVGFGGSFLNFDSDDYYRVDEDMYVAYAEEGRVRVFSHSATVN